MSGDTKGFGTNDHAVVKGTKDAVKWAKGNAFKCQVCTPCVFFFNSKEQVKHLESKHKMNIQNHKLIYGAPKTKEFECRVLNCATSTSHNFRNITTHLEQYHQMTLMEYFKKHVLELTEIKTEFDPSLRLAKGKTIDLCQPPPHKKMKATSEVIKPERTSPVSPRVTHDESSVDKKFKAMKKVKVNQMKMDSYLVASPAKPTPPLEHKPAAPDHKTKLLDSPKVTRGTKNQLPSRAIVNQTDSPGKTIPSGLKSGASALRSRASDSLATRRAEVSRPAIKRLVKKTEGDEARRPIKFIKDNVQTKADMEEKPLDTLTGCVLYCELCEHRKPFTLLSEFKRHIERVHRIADKRQYVVGNYGAKVRSMGLPYHQLSLTECQTCKAVILDEVETIDNHNLTAHQIQPGGMKGVKMSLRKRGNNR